ncbi:MAG: D-alanyl-D-alanine carboxypeptidase/D-alanyl-D-alanine-endopeptidase [Candidatus Acidiferrales bacterium]
MILSSRKVTDFGLSYRPIIDTVPAVRVVKSFIQPLKILRLIARLRVGNVCAALLFMGFCCLAVHCVSARQLAPAPQRQSASSPANARPDVKRFRVRVDAALAEIHARKAFWGVLVVDRDTGQTLYELNADHFFTPASNAKIFTSSLAFATLGPSFQFRSTLESAGRLGPDGHLAGDMVFVGRGDPDISNRKFPYAGKVEHEGPTQKVLERMADDAIAKGLKEIEGDIIADDSYYPYDPYPPGWSIGDLFFTFGAPIGAVTFNDNCISVEIRPADHAGDPATIIVEPAAALETFAHDIKTIPADGKPEIGVARQAGPNFLLVRGTIPAGHAPIKLDLAMTDPGEITALTLKQIFQAKGVPVTGNVRVLHAPPPEIYPDAPVVVGPVPAPPLPTVIVFAEHLSPPLSEIARVTNKVSQNLHAELLLRAVGRQKKGFGVTDAGLWVEQDFLKSVGVADGDVVLTDGSGLSPDDLVTPRAVVQLLRYDAQQAWGPDYISTFPIAAVDGTLENRFKNARAAGQILAKTGALEHVHAMSGFATTQRGERVIFALFGNHSPERGRDATVVIDAIASAMIETLGPQALPRPAKKK